MSKNKKKNRWFSNVTHFSLQDKQTKDLFSNTIKKHEERLAKIEDQTAQEREYLVDDAYYDEDYGYSSYNWDLDRKLMNKGSQDHDAKKSYEYAKKDFGDYYSSGNDSWRGYNYYQKPQLSYKYVQQIANALSAQHRIKIEIGNEWKVDLLNKTLTYNPASLVYGTKGELLATLMHEIGKLRYCTHTSQLNNKYLTVYDLPAKEVLSIFEDVRVDYFMLKSYESAGEVYESVIPIIEKQVEDYIKRGEVFKEALSDMTALLYKQTRDKYQVKDKNGNVMPFDANHAWTAQFKQDLLMIFGMSEEKDVEDRLEQLRMETALYGTIFDYCGEMVSLMYDLDAISNGIKFQNITEKVEKTTDAIESSKKKKDSQELIDYLDTAMYPHVEDLLQDFTDKNQQLQSMFPNMPEEVKKSLINMAIETMANSSNAEGKRMGRSQNIEENGDVRTRNSGQTNSTVPPEWLNGDYKPIRDSVQSEIRQLINRLTFLRREEMAMKYTADQKRGKLNSRKLYRSATGNRRLFKNKVENMDTVRSFAFSVLMDVSGSMSGSRIAHTTRAVTILGEVFKKMDIPFEFVTFSDGVKVVKPFEKEMDRSVERDIGGLPRHSGGGTNLDRGLDALKIHGRPEKNKVVIVLTDGGVGDPKQFDNEYFIPWSKKGIKSVGFGIECEKQMAQLCQGDSKMLSSASKLPVEFSELLKRLIKRKK